jgi:hypothetical protein
VNGFKEKDIMNICGAVSKKTSLKIWDENGGIGKNRTFKPILYKCGACAGKGTSFPSEFKTIIEAKEGTLYKMHSIVRQPPEYDSIYDVAALARVATLARLPNFFHL